MTKTELIAKIASDANLTKEAAAKAFDSFIQNITDGLKKGEDISIPGFGKFSVVERKARMGRNIKTGQPIEIAARRTPRFSPGSQLKEELK
jgi:DNA-binding protein HU-beta